MLTLDLLYAIIRINQRTEVIVLYDLIEMNKRMKVLKQRLGYTNEALSAASDIPLGTINKILSKKSSEPLLSNIIKIADALDVPASYLIFGNEGTGQTNDRMRLLYEKYRALDERGRQAVDNALDFEYKQSRIHRESPALTQISMLSLPRAYNAVSAGTGAYLVDNHSEMLELPKTYLSEQADFVIEVSGNSMEPIYQDGELVLVKEQPEINVGDIGIFVMDNEAYMKALGKDGLVSLNPKYPKIIPVESAEVVCVGKVLGKL